MDLRIQSLAFLEDMLRSVKGYANDPDAHTFMDEVVEDEYSHMFHLMTLTDMKKRGVWTDQYSSDKERLNDQFRVASYIGSDDDPFVDDSIAMLPRFRTNERSPLSDPMRRRIDSRHTTLPRIDSRKPTLRDKFDFPVR